MDNNEQNPNELQRPRLHMAGCSSSNLIKELKVVRLLGKMMNSNMQLYEQILDEPEFAFYFGELVKLAQR